MSVPPLELPLPAPANPLYPILVDESLDGWPFDIHELHPGVRTEKKPPGQPGPEAAVWPSPGGSLPQPGHVLSRSGSGPRSEAEAARQQPEADHERTLLAAVLAKAANKTSEEARQKAQAEGLTLLVAGNKAGYFGVWRSERSVALAG